MKKAILILLALTVSAHAEPKADATATPAITSDEAKGFSVRLSKEPALLSELARVRHRVISFDLDVACEEVCPTSEEVRRQIRKDISQEIRNAFGKKGTLLRVLPYSEATTEFELSFRGVATPNGLTRKLTYLIYFVAPVDERQLDEGSEQESAECRERDYC